VRHVRELVFVSDGAGPEASVAAHSRPGEDGGLPDPRTVLAGLDLVPLPPVHLRAAQTERRKGQGGASGPQQFLRGQQCLQVSQF